MGKKIMIVDTSERDSDVILNVLKDKSSVKKRMSRKLENPKRNYVIFIVFKTDLNFISYIYQGGIFTFTHNDDINALKNEFQSENKSVFLIRISENCEYEITIEFADKTDIVKLVPSRGDWVDFYGKSRFAIKALKTIEVLGTSYYDIITLHLQPLTNKKIDKVPPLIGRYKKLIKRETILIGTSGGDDFRTEAAKSGAKESTYTDLKAIIEDIRKQGTPGDKVYSFFLKQPRVIEIERIGAQLLKDFDCLYLAVQAFFGIGHDNESRAYPGDAQEINSVKETDTGNGKNKRFNIKFPDKNIFLLDKEVPFDFYAEIGGRLSSDANPFVGGDYKKLSYLKLVEELFKAEGIQLYNEFYDGSKKKKINGTVLKSMIEKILSDRDIKTLCAILGNIVDNGINKAFFGKKLSAQALKNHKQIMETGRSNLKSYCPPGQKHTKWPKGFNFDEMEPDDSYNKLVEQLENWNGKKEMSKVVLRKIETLYEYIQQVLNFYRTVL